jgi:HD-GYP domain-containing protein (c-di-GMP phosphodiesterase class II)
MAEYGRNADLLARIEKLNAIGIALSAEKDVQSLLEKILTGAKAITNADGGTLYSLHEDGKLYFEIIRATSLGIEMGGSTGAKVDFRPIPLFLPNGRPNHRMVVVYATLQGETVNVGDVYRNGGFDFSGPKAFDRKTGYHSKSLLTIPMRNHENDIIGVLQLINKQDKYGETVAFDKEDQQLAESLASQAAIALTNNKLISDLRGLFDAFTRTIAVALDEKSPHTGGHCNRVPILAMMMANKANAAVGGPMKDFTMSGDELYALEVASWLHDCGKVTTPEYVVDKATKLETIFDRVQLIDARFEILKRDASIRRLERLAEADEQAKALIEKGYAREIRRIEEDRAFIRRCNTGGEFMAPEDRERVREIGRRSWTNPEGQREPFLTENEIYNLQISKGTLNPEEIEVIRNHVVMSQKMLAALPFPKNMKQVPEYAGGHHEHMDGTGYPNGLTREQMSIPARIIAIADVFEALTAADRPYKEAKKLSESLKILGMMKKDRKIDPDLFDFFIQERIYLDYAQTFLDPEQIDIDDPSEIPGYPFDQHPVANGWSVRLPAKKLAFA